MNFPKENKFIFFTIKFLLLFAIFYYGTLTVIGLAAPDEYYSPFVAKYLDYVSLLTSSLVHGTKLLLSLFGIDTYLAPNFIIRIVNGTGVRIAYDCVGYGVMSFWAAFVIASPVYFRKKILWLPFGLFLLWFINVSRISLLLVAYNKHWTMPLGLDHHTWFNIVAYIAIFIMIYFFDRSGKRVSKIAPKQTNI
jgi:exosortase/archaeosortase family protein